MAAAVGPALFPGSSTFPGTTVFPGQDNLPLHRVMVSHSDFAVSPPVWTDYSSRARAISVSRGRNSELDNFDAGSATVVLDNRDRVLDPFINAAVRPMNRVWIYAEFSGDRRDLFQGYAEAWQESWDRSGIVDAVTTLRAVDESKVLNLQTLAASGTVTRDRADIMLNALLDGISSRAPRSFQTGNAGVSSGFTSTAASQAVLGELQLAAGSDFVPGVAINPVLFISASGTLVFLNAAQRNNAPYDTVQATFGDAGGTELPYQDCQLDYSDSFLFNTWTVTSTVGGTPDSSSDAASIAAYGIRANTRSIMVDLSLVATNTAASFVAKYKDPFQRVVTVKPNMADATTCQNVLARDLMDRIRLLRTPPGGGARIDEQLFVQRINYAATPGVPPDCELGVSPL